MGVCLRHRSFGKCVAHQAFNSGRKDGTAVVAERVFTTSRAMQALCHRVKELTSTGKYSVFTLYAGSAELHREMQIMLSEQNGLRNLPAYPITPAIASHVGPYSLVWALCLVICTDFEGRIRDLFCLILFSGSLKTDFKI